MVTLERGWELCHAPHTSDGDHSIRIMSAAACTNGTTIVANFRRRCDGAAAAVVERLHWRFRLRALKNVAFKLRAVKVFEY